MVDACIQTDHSWEENIVVNNHIINNRTTACMKESIDHGVNHRTNGVPSKSREPSAGRKNDSSWMHNDKLGPLKQEAPIGKNPFQRKRSSERKRSTETRKPAIERSKKSDKQTNEDSNGCFDKIRSRSRSKDRHHRDRESNRHRHRHRSRSRDKERSDYRREERHERSHRHRDLRDQLKFRTSGRTKRGRDAAAENTTCEPQPSKAKRNRVDINENCALALERNVKVESSNELPSERSTVDKNKPGSENWQKTEQPCTSTKEDKAFEQIDPSPSAEKSAASQDNAEEGKIQSPAKELKTEFKTEVKHPSQLNFDLQCQFKQENSGEVNLNAQNLVELEQQTKIPFDCRDIIDTKSGNISLALERTVEVDNSCDGNELPSKCSTVDKNKFDSENVQQRKQLCATIKEDKAVEHIDPLPSAEKSVANQDIAEEGEIRSLSKVLNFDLQDQFKQKNRKEANPNAENLVKLKQQDEISVDCRDVIDKKSENITLTRRSRARKSIEPELHGVATDEKPSTPMPIIHGFDLWDTPIKINGQTKSRDSNDNSMENDIDPYDNLYDDLALATPNKSEVERVGNSREGTDVQVYEIQSVLQVSEGLKEELRQVSQENVETEFACRTSENSAQCLSSTISNTIAHTRAEIIEPPVETATPITTEADETLTEQQSESSTLIATETESIIQEPQPIASANKSLMNVSKIPSDYIIETDAVTEVTTITIVRKRRKKPKK